MCRFVGFSRLYLMSLEWWLYNLSRNQNHLSLLEQWHSPQPLWEVLIQSVGGRRGTGEITFRTSSRSCWWSRRTSLEKITWLGEGISCKDFVFFFFFFCSLSRILRKVFQRLCKDIFKAHLIWKFPIKTMKALLLWMLQVGANEEINGIGLTVAEEESGLFSVD